MNTCFEGILRCQLTRRPCASVRVPTRHRRFHATLELSTDEHVWYAADDVSDSTDRPYVLKHTC